MTDVNSRTIQTNVRAIVAFAEKNMWFQRRIGKILKISLSIMISLALKNTSSLKSSFMRLENCPARDKQASLKCS